MAEWNQPRRVYAAEFPCGVVKVGITSQPGPGRESNLRFRGARPVRMHYGQHHECGSWAERELIQRMRRLATAIQGREWFVGQRFGLVKQLVDQVTRMAIALSEQEREAA
jgi:hypothetical protein